MHSTKFQSDLGNKVTWLTHTCNSSLSVFAVNHLYLWHDSFIRVAWLVDIEGVLINPPRNGLKALLYSSWPIKPPLTHVVICVACFIHMFDMTHSYEHWTPLDPPRHMCNLSICVTWLMHISPSKNPLDLPRHMHDMTHSYVWHDLFIRVTWLNHMSPSKLPPPPMDESHVTYMTHTYEPL